MSPILTPQGMFLATAMAVSGSFLLLAFGRLQKSTTTTEFSVNSVPVLQSPDEALPRSCISPDGKKKEKKKKKKKRVHFAEDVVEPKGNSEEYRRMHRNNYLNTNNNTSSNANPLKRSGGKMQEIQANRMALYNGILRDRVLRRVTYSY